MILSHPNWESPIIFEGDSIKAIVVESPDAMAELLSQLNDQVQGNTGPYVWSVHGKPITIRGNVGLVFNPFVVSPNEKQIISKVYSTVVNASLGEDKYALTNDMLSRLESFINSILMDVDVSLHAGAFRIDEIIKAVAPCFDEDYSSLLERVCDYLDAATKYARIVLFAFVHLRSYFSEEDYNLFLRHVSYQKYNVILFETDVNCLSGKEELVIIDHDLCEIRTKDNNFEV
jgi:CRISPR type II-A-associated protein Csn2